MGASRFVCLTLLVGCAYDFGVFDGAGGANTGGTNTGGTTVATGSSSSGLGGSEGGQGGSNAGGAGGLPQSSSSSSTGSGGQGGSGPTFYPPCGAHTDNFQSLDTTRWTLFNASHDSGDQFIDVNPAFDPPNNLVQGYAHLRPAQIQTRCFLSMRLEKGTYSTLAYMALLATPRDWLEVRTINDGQNDMPTSQFRRVENLVQQPGTPINTPENATHLGMLVETDEAVFYASTDSATTWISLGSVARPSWLNGMVEVEIGVYAPNSGTGASNEGASLDDFNLPAVEVGTLPSP